jgi:hypothetical protein
MDRLEAKNLVRTFVRVVASIPTTFRISDNLDKMQNENFVLARNLLRQLNKTPKNLVRRTRFRTTFRTSQGHHLGQDFGHLSL